MYIIHIFIDDSWPLSKLLFILQLCFCSDALRDYCSYTKWSWITKRLTLLLHIVFCYFSYKCNVNCNPLLLLMYLYPAVSHPHTHVLLIPKPNHTTLKSSKLYLLVQMVKLQVNIINTYESLMFYITQTLIELLLCPKNYMAHMKIQRF